MTEKQSKAAWQAANAQARREDKRASWAECCGRPTSRPVAVCADCAAAAVRARLDNRTRFEANRARRLRARLAAEVTA